MDIFQPTEEKAFETFEIIQEEVPDLFIETEETWWPTPGLDPNECKKARLKHMNISEGKKVCEEADEKTWKGRTVDGRWVEDARESEGEV